MDEGRQPPFGIDLAPWATDIAKELHHRFGDDVELVVGAFSYPDRKPQREHAGAPEDIPDMDLTLMTVELDAPIVVASGHTVRGALRCPQPERERHCHLYQRTGNRTGGRPTNEGCRWWFRRYAEATAHTFPSRSRRDRGRARAGRHRQPFP